MSQALRKLTGIVSKSKTCLIFINQIREKSASCSGNPETTTGGRALKFYASVRVDVRRIASIKDGDEIVGSRTKAKIVKNKVALPSAKPSSTSFTAKHFPRRRPARRSRRKEHRRQERILVLLPGRTPWPGRENARQFLKDNHEYRGRIELALREIMEWPFQRSLPLPPLPPKAPGRQRQTPVNSKLTPRPLPLKERRGGQF